MNLPASYCTPSVPSTCSIAIDCGVVASTVPSRGATL